MSRQDSTVRRLQAGLGELLMERAIDDLVVEDVLHQSGVARSTFYRHFASLDDLFLSCLGLVSAEVWRGWQADLAAGRSRWGEACFLRPLLRHLAGHQGLWLRVGQSSWRGFVIEELHRILERFLGLDWLKAGRTGNPAFVAGGIVRGIELWMRDAASSDVEQTLKVWVSECTSGPGRLGG